MGSVHTQASGKKVSYDAEDSLLLKWCVSMRQIETRVQI